MIAYKTSKIFTLLCILSLCYCASGPDLGPIPTLEFVSLSKNSMEQGFFNEDSVTLVLNFTDGDGDIGDVDGNIMPNLFVIDNRLDTLADPFVLPNIPAQGIGNGVQGEIRIRLFTTCCLIEGITPCDSSPDFPTDTLSYDVFMVDRAGNESNVVTTTMVTLLCN